jgi:hypothetical protein
MGVAEDGPLDGVEDVSIEVGVVPHGGVAALLTAVAVLAEAVVQRLALTALASDPTTTRRT